MNNMNIIHCQDETLGEILAITIIDILSPARYLLALSGIFGRILWEEPQVKAFCVKAFIQRDGNVLREEIRRFTRNGLNFSEASGLTALTLMQVAFEP